MATRRLAALLMLSLAALLLTSPATAGETKTISDKNIKWTLPDEGAWSFMTLTESHAKAGYVAGAQGNDVGTQMHLMRRKAEGLSTTDFANEVVGYVRTVITKVKSSKAFKGSLSGLDAHAVYVYGKTKDDTEVHATLYVLSKGDFLYLLMVQAFHGAHKKHWKILDAAKRGVRLIEGAGPEESPAISPVGDGGGDTVKGSGSGGAVEGAGDGEGGVGDLDPAKWPSEGPKLEGRTIVFPSHNLRWSVKEGTPWRVFLINKDEKAHGQPLVAFVQKDGEGEKANTCEVAIMALKRGAGFTTQALVNDIEYQEAIAKSFHSRLPGGVTLEEEYEFAGLTGSAFGLKGKTEEGEYITVVDYWIALRGEAYRFRTVSTGERGCEAKFEASVKELFAGIEFPETTEPVPGPVAGPVAFHVMPRGNYRTKSYTVKAPALEVEKPEGFGKLTGLNDGNMHFAFEMRTEDGTAYYYVDVASYENAALSQNNIKVEDWVEERSVDWADAATGDVKLRKGKKTKGPMHIKAKWGKAKGIGWRFEAEFHGHPFVEYGYLVRHKQRTYRIREQFGGVDAEKKLKSTRKALMKKWKWLKK